jgi:N-acetyl-anhydromuramyl-L-alanine amidase AmpD
VPSLQAGTTYYWEVHGRSNSQFGTWSSIFSFTTATVVTPPVAPNNLQSTAISSTRIDIAWQDRASNESGFHIWSWDGSQLLLIASVSAGTQSFSQTGLSPSTTYSYYVSAFNGAGDTFTSSFTSATTLSATITEPAGLLWTPSPNFDRRPSGQIIDSIVIHTTEGSYDSTISEFQNSHPENPNLQRSAHYVIKPNGEITQMIALANRAYHATYYNSRSIGIEMVGAASQQSTWNTQNMDALATLVAYLVTRFPTIPVVHPLGDATGTSNCRFNEVGLVAHSQIQPVAQCISGQGLNQKTDPGVYFQWNAFADSVNAKLGLPIVTISATAPNASENGPTAGTFKISRGSSTAGILVVQYSVGGTASSGDYQSISNTATILDGQSSVTVTVRPVDDNLAGEGTETVVLTLAADVGYSVGSPNRATVSIADNDSIPAEIKVRQGTTVIADNSTTAVQFGTVAQGDAAKELIFNVQNMGGSPLTVGNIVLDNNIGFTVTQQPASPVAAGQSTTFKLRMSASSVGAKSANVRFTSNDLNESPFNFGVAGNVIPITCTLAPLGALSKQFESGSAGPGVISSGNGDPGGKSYGVWQFSLNKGTLAKFVNRFYSDYFSNLTLASSAFDAKWRQLAADDPTGFRNAQFEFAKAQFYDVFIKRLAATFGLDAEARSRAFQNVVWSTAIQHGAKNKVFDHALQPLLQGRTISDLTDEEIIVAVYHERARTDSSGTPVYFKNSSPSVQQAQLRRFRAESAKALKELSDEANC